MRIKEIIAAAVIGAVCIAVPVSQSRQPQTESLAAGNASAGLIEKGVISCSGGAGEIKITAKTQTSGIMNELGFLNVTIQRSDDCKSWIDESSLGDFTEKSKKYTTLSLSEGVSGGHYYRVTCVHYAAGIPFQGKSEVSQTAENLSKAVWIAAAEVTTTTKPATTTISVTTQAAPTTAYNTSSRTTAAVTPTGAAGTSGAVTASNAKTGARTTTVTAAVTAAPAGTNTGSPATGVPAPGGALTAGILAVTVAFTLRRKNV